MKKDSETTIKNLQQLFAEDRSKRNESADERQELARLLERLPAKIPQPGSPEHEAYTNTQQQIEALKQRVAKKHRELIDLLHGEEKTGKEIREKNKNYF